MGKRSADWCFWPIPSAGKWMEVAQAFTGLVKQYEFTRSEYQPLDTVAVPVVSAEYEVQNSYS